MSENLQEIGYEMGSRQAWRSILASAIRELGTEGDVERWRLEREDAVLKLREVCAEHGDNEWDNELHLADVIEKHLFRHLHK